MREGFVSSDRLDLRLVAGWVGLLLAAGIVVNLAAVASRAAGVPLFD